jgi:predicted PhzF superfamily epimerase YddE/YHI9
MTQAIVVVDAFTDVPFAGNPAAVVILPGPAPEEWMRNVAREMNLAETAFLYKKGDHYALRWFTPTIEVDLCGHATLGSAHVLWQDGHLSPDAEARFQTRSGLLTARRLGERIVLDFPTLPAAPCPAPPQLLAGLGAEARWVGKNSMDYLVELVDETTVRSLTPDMNLLANLPKLPGRGVIVTSRAESERPYDFVSRFFAPAAGIPEDPVTGSAHCALGPYWRQTFGRDAMIGYQASPRGGTVYVECRGDRVLLGGQAVMVVRGELVG